MARGGYAGEYAAKKMLGKMFGDENVLKIAIAQVGADFMVIVEGKLVLLVEVKETIKEKYYSSKREKEQFRRIKEFAEAQNCRAELWIYYRKGSGKPMDREVRVIHPSQNPLDSFPNPLDVLAQRPLAL